MTAFQPGVGGPVTRPLSGEASSLETEAGEGAGSLSAVPGVIATVRYVPGVAGPLSRPISFAPSAPASTGATAAAEGTGTLTARATEIIGQSAGMAGHGTLAAAGASHPGTTFVITVACGDNSVAGTAVLPSGWTALHTVTATNGTDHTADAVLAAACTELSAASVTIDSTATAAEGIAGAASGFLVGAPSPVPEGINPAWPYTVFEVGFGSGYLTPPDQVQWVNLQAFANGKRLRALDDQSGIQYELDALESAETTLVLDDPDGALTPFNAESPWYPDVVPGTPWRYRTVPPASAGTARWYVLQRNMEHWPQEWDSQFRGLSNAEATDPWSIVNRGLPSPYRADVRADSPTHWWPMDDQPGLGGVIPSQMANAAQGSTTALQVKVSPAGTFSIDSLTFYPHNATRAVAVSEGWMYGDPQSSPTAGGPGGPVSAQPGSAAWQQTGNVGSGTGWYLSATDTAFPSLAGGVTISGWWQYEFANTTTVLGDHQVPSQPLVALVLWQIATSAATTACLSLSTAGALQMTTYSGSTATTTTVYSGADLRNQTWFSVDVTMTPTTWTCWLNGGVTAKVSGSAAGMNPAWTWLWAGAGSGTAGGTGTGSLTGAGNAQVSHLAVYPLQLPAWRILSHYSAAVTGYGTLPCPTSAAVEWVSGAAPGVVPDGNLVSGSYGRTTYSPMAVEVTAVAGAYTSGPSAEAVIVSGVLSNGGDMYITWSGVAPSFGVYTSEQAAAEELALTSVTASADLKSGYGSGAVPPTAASSLGDTVSQRIERLLASGLALFPRCIDTATALVQAALDTAGQVSGTSVSNIVASDGGFMFTDALGSLCYYGRPRLGGTAVVTWDLGPDVGAGQIPYLNDGAKLDTDPHRIFNDVEITPYAPDGSVLPIITPVDAAAALVSQQQYGVAQRQVTSYLQSTALMQEQANWTLTTFGQAQQRVASLTVDAAPMAGSCPQAWIFVLSANPGDIVQATVSQPGQPSSTRSFRLTRIHRVINFAAGTARAEVQCDVLPPDEWGV